jgi:hypothetical protein
LDFLHFKKSDRTFPHLASCNINKLTIYIDFNSQYSVVEEDLWIIQRFFTNIFMRMTEANRLQGNGFGSAPQSLTWGRKTFIPFTGWASNLSCFSGLRSMNAEAGGSEVSAVGEDLPDPT